MSDDLFREVDELTKNMDSLGKLQGKPQQHQPQGNFAVSTSGGAKIYSLDSDLNQPPAQASMAAAYA